MIASGHVTVHLLHPPIDGLIVSSATTSDITAPVAPDSRSLITTNITFTLLILTAWSDGGCPIQQFSIQYKLKTSIDWLMFSNHITASQDTVTIDDLPPGSWFDLLVLAKNSAGMTEANYAFSTLTESGATVAPLLFNSENTYNANSLDAIMIILPSACAVVVLVMITFAGLYLMINKPPHSADGLPCDERGKTREHLRLIL